MNLQNTLLITVLAVIFTALDIFGQNVHKAFNRNYNIVTLHPVFTCLYNSSDHGCLESRPSPGGSLGYNYVFSTGRFYGLGAGVSIGYVSYKIQPKEASLSMYSTTNRLINLNIPVHIKKHYPFNHRLGMAIKTGVNFSRLFSSLVNFGCIIIDDVYLYNMEVEIKPVIQFGLLCEFELTYCLKSNNFISIGVTANKNIFNAIIVDYEYYENSEGTPMTGKLKSTVSNIGGSISYHFKLNKNG